MPRLEQHVLNEYISLLRNRDNAAEALEQCTTTINLQTGLLQNFFTPRSQKYKAQYEDRKTKTPVEQQLDFPSALARDIATARAKVQAAKDDRPMWEKHLTTCEQALSRFVQAHPETTQLTLETALELVSTDPSGDTTKTERLADAAASEMEAQASTEMTASRKS